MQADWEVEIGAGAPVIDAGWPGFIDLRLHPALAWSLEEAARFPKLAPALVWLNRTGSPVWTAKCDIWEPGEVDPDELDAPRETDLKAIACYIDLLPRESLPWVEVEDAVRWCKNCCLQLKQIPVPSSRTDMIVRSAVNCGREDANGVTAYLVACAREPRGAERALGNALDIFAYTVAAIPAQ